MTTPQFTIGIVNYKSSVYMETQLKIYRSFAGENVDFFIVDTSNVNEEFANLKKITQKFDMPIRVHQLNTRGKYSSDAHGTGLQYIYEKTSTEYLLTQDPDFFWVLPGFLTLLKNKLQNNCVVGAAYHTPHLAGWCGHPWFPTAIGAAHRMKDLKEVNADFRYTNEFVSEGVLKDVGWQVREKLKDRPYYYFSATKTHLPIGQTYSRTDWQKYMDGQTKVAYHIMRGTFEVKCTTGMSLAYGKIANREELRKMQPPARWQQSRRRACAFFWREIKETASRMGYR